MISIASSLSFFFPLRLLFLLMCNFFVSFSVFWCVFQYNAVLYSFLVSDCVFTTIYLFLYFFLRLIFIVFFKFKISVLFNLLLSFCVKWKCHLLAEPFFIYYFSHLLLLSLSILFSHYKFSTLFYFFSVFFLLKFSILFTKKKKWKMIVKLLKDRDQKIFFLEIQKFI